MDSTWALSNVESVSLENYIMIIATESLRT